MPGHFPVDPVAPLGAELVRRDVAAKNAVPDKERGVRQDVEPLKDSVDGGKVCFVGAPRDSGATVAVPDKARARALRPDRGDGWGRCTVAFQSGSPQARLLDVDHHPLAAIDSPNVAKLHSEVTKEALKCKQPGKSLHWSPDRDDARFTLAIALAVQMEYWRFA